MDDDDPPWRTRDQTLIARQLRREVSKTERKLWPYLRGSQLGAPFRRQHLVAGKYSDYCCVPLKLVIEIDGPTHDRGRDSERDALMAMHGYDVLRFSVQEIDQSLEGVISTLHDAVQLRLQAAKHAARAPPLSPP